MKVNEDMRFPHPVLWHQTQDYPPDSRFGFAVGSTVEVAEHDGVVDISAEIELTNDDLASAVSAGRVELGLNVVCEATYLSEVQTCAIGTVRHRLQCGGLSGTVTARPIAWVVKPFLFSDFSSVADEFRMAPIQAAPGMVAAIGEPFQFTVGSDKHAPLATIFELSLAPQLERWRFLIQLDGEFVSIQAGPDAHKTIAALRGTGTGRGQVLNGVYLPVLQRVIDELKRPEFDASARRWSRVVAAKLAHAGINSASVDALEAAQLLLNDPLQRWRMEE